MPEKKHKPLNPYIAGSALEGPEGFFGREDILQLVETELRSPHQNAVVLFGQRRIGKTSILLQLRGRLPESGFVPVYLDLMDRARWRLGAVLAELADRVALELGLDPPESERFDDEGRHFRQGFLPSVYKALGEDEAARRLVFLFDEFDVLDRAAAEDLPDTAAARTFFPYLRELMGQEKRLGFVIVVGRKTEELSIDFRAAFRAARYQKISVLKEDDARALILLSKEEGTLRYTGPAVARILALTTGHPYFTQLTCFLLFNRAWAVGGEDVPLVNTSDVDAIVPRVLEAGNNAFEWVWDGLPPAERVIFSAIAEGTEEGQVLDEDQILQVLQEHGIRILIRELELAPRTLVEWDMLCRVNGGYRFFIELMRRWVVSRKPLVQVREELDHVVPLADQLYEAAHTCYREENLEEAIPLLHQALARNPNHLKARLLLGTCLREQEDLQAAIKEFEVAYEFDAQAGRYELVRTLLQRGQRLEGKGDEGEALAVYERVLQVSPRERVARERRAAIFEQRGDAALETGDYEAALAAFQEAGAEEKLRQAAARKRQLELETFARQGKAAEAIEDWDAAVKVYERLIQQDADNPRWQQAMDNAQREQWLKARYTAGLGAVEQKQWTIAQRALADVINERPDYREATRYLHLAVTGEDVAHLRSPLRLIPGWARATAVILALMLLSGGVWLGSQIARPTATPVAMTTLTQTPTSTMTATPTDTPTSTSTVTPTATPTDMATPTFTSTPTATSTPTDTPTPTSGPTPVPVAGVTRVWEKDGSVMVYVPPGKFLMGSDENDPDAEGDEKPQHEVSLDAFWIDRTEVTNGQYQLCVGAGVCTPPSSFESYARTSYYGTPEFDNYPVIYVDWNQAKAYCRWAGKRLPTEAEWEKAARGTDGSIYPWGDDFDGRRLNFCDDNCYLEWKDATWNDGQADTAPVGSYPAGGSPYGVLDMAGNVWEWVADWYDSGYYAESPESKPEGPPLGNQRVVRGGSWDGNQRVVRTADRYSFEPSNGSGVVGFRCAQADAEPLPAETPAPKAGETRVWEKDDAVMVYVPEGPFWMGSNDSDPDAEEREKPQHEVYLDGFWIDRTEVTNLQYQRCVETGACLEPAQCMWGDPTYGDPTKGNYPAVCVSWDDAHTYCSWAGKRLPTEAEWEKAARGTDKRLYPWGNDFDGRWLNYCDTNCNENWRDINSDDGYSGAAPVGNYPAGASPYGILDMAGNVREWVADWYDPTYYIASPSNNPQGPESGDYRIVRGGSLYDPREYVRVAYRVNYDPDITGNIVGFRCARSGVEPSSTITPTVVPTVTPLPGHERGTGTLVGTLLWNETPLSDLLVELVQNSPEGSVVASATTDEQGQFVFGNFPPGSYLPRAHYPPGDTQTLLLSGCPPFDDFDVTLFEADVPRVCTFHVYKKDIEILSPEEGSSLNTSPTFVWVAYPDATEYRVSISLGTPHESGIYYREILTDRVAETSWRVPEELKTGLYAFNIQAFNVHDHRIARVSIYEFSIP